MFKRLQYYSKIKIHKSLQMNETYNGIGNRSFEVEESGIDICN